MSSVRSLLWPMPLFFCALICSRASHYLFEMKMYDWFITHNCYLQGTFIAFMTTEVARNRHQLVIITPNYLKMACPVQQSGSAHSMRLFESYSVHTLPQPLMFYAIDEVCFNYPPPLFFFNPSILAADAFASFFDELTLT